MTLNPASKTLLAHESFCWTSAQLKEFMVRNNLKHEDLAQLLGMRWRQMYYLASGACPIQPLLVYRLVTWEHERLKRAAARKKQRKQVQARVKTQARSQPQAQLQTAA